MKYFVTGATGFIGGRLARQLLEAGHDVTALVRHPDKAGHLEAMGVSLAQGDITRRDTLPAAMEGADGVFHLAAWYKVGARDRRVAENINVNGTRNVLEVMKDLGIKKGVYTSTVAVFSDTAGRLVDESYRYDGRHLSEYDRTKWVAHYEVALPMIEAGLPLVIVQPGAVYGPGDTSAVGEAFRQYLRKRLPVVPKGMELCWSHVDDVAHGHVLAMDKGKPGESYILAGQRRTLEDVLGMAEEITGVKGPRIRLGPGTLRFMARITSVFEPVLPLPDSYRSESLRVTAGTTYIADNAKAVRELGYSVRALRDGLRETFAAMMDEMHAKPL